MKKKPINVKKALVAVRDEIKLMKKLEKSLIRLSKGEYFTLEELFSKSNK